MEGDPETRLRRVNHRVDSEFRVDARLVVTWTRHLAWQREPHGPAASQRPSPPCPSSPRPRGRARHLMPFEKPEHLFRRAPMQPREKALPSSRMVSALAGTVLRK